MKYEVRSFDQLSVHELYAILKLRSDVFVVEQDCVYSDYDGNDSASQHLLGWRDGRIVGYARWFVEEDELVLGRIVLAPEARGNGRGRHLIERALAEIGPRIVKIHAQLALAPYYESLGWVRRGDVYDDYRIPHIVMTRQP